MTAPGQDNFDNKNSVEQNGNNNENGEGFLNKIRNFLDNLTHKEVKKSKDETEDLKKNMIENALDNLHNKIGAAFETADVTQETKDKLNNFFTKSKEELTDDKYSVYEELVKQLMKTDRFKNRSEGAVTNIVKSAGKIEEEINKWPGEKSLVAKYLLGLVWRIMNTEK